MKLDLCSVYNLVWICRRDEWNTALCGHFECTAMFFCLMNVSLIFQHMVNDIFRDFLDIFIIVTWMISYLKKNLRVA